MLFHAHQGEHKTKVPNKRVHTNCDDDDHDDESLTCMDVTVKLLDEVTDDLERKKGEDQRKSKK
jgi:hypothetical protein